MIKVGMISLGCPKNQVDAEIMLKTIEDGGFTLTNREDDADVIFVNSCGFLESAAEEAIEAILEAASYREAGVLKALIVTGCLAERYKDDISAEIPEVDVVVGIGSNKDIVEIINNTLKGKKQNYFGNKLDLCLNGNRVLTTPSYLAYLKIAEGCSNCCSYCAIPSIRGPFRSREMNEILHEAKVLAENGVKELVVIAQDTTRYGEDLYGKPQLAKLLKQLCKIEGLKIIRTLYTYPDRIDDELIEAVKTESKLAKYFDIPIQHSEDKILKAMNRRTTKAELIALIEKLRKEIPDVAIRTTLITGFPGETEEDFTNLAEFVVNTKFDKLGCFPYSQEEGTFAAKMENQVELQTRYDRAENIMNEQIDIAAEKNSQKIGKIFDCIVEGYDGGLKAYFGRTMYDAPEIDGKVFFKSDEKIENGEIVRVQINDYIEYDLLGEKV